MMRTLNTVTRAVGQTTPEIIVQFVNELLNIIIKAAFHAAQPYASSTNREE